MATRLCSISNTIFNVVDPSSDNTVVTTPGLPIFTDKNILHDIFPRAYDEICQKTLAGYNLVPIVDT